MQIFVIDACVDSLTAGCWWALAGGRPSNDQWRFQSIGSAPCFFQSAGPNPSFYDRREGVGTARDGENTPNYGGEEYALSIEHRDEPKS
jgi:hypothetical protein